MELRDRVGSADVVERAPRIPMALCAGVLVDVDAVVHRHAIGNGLFRDETIEFRA